MALAIADISTWPGVRLISSDGIAHRKFFGGTSCVLSTVYLQLARQGARAIPDITPSEDLLSRESHRLGVCKAHPHVHPRSGVYRLVGTARDNGVFFVPPSLSNKETNHVNIFIFLSIHPFSAGLLSHWGDFSPIGLSNSIAVALAQMGPSRLEPLPSILACWLYPATPDLAIGDALIVRGYILDDELSVYILREIPQLVINLNHCLVNRKVPRSSRAPVYQA